MKSGKLPLAMLTRLLSEVKIKDRRVALGPSPGEDAALIDFGDRYLVAKTDPITFATDLIGWYLVQINANDIAVMGGKPRWMMATLLMPESTKDTEIQLAFRQLLKACENIGVTLIGGHTEITVGLPRPLAVGAMLGEVDKETVVFTSGARPGDAIILTKSVAIEGTAILAREAEASLLKAGLDSALIEKARALLFKPGISVLEDAAIASSTKCITAMHDPTEGGLAGGLLEIANCAGVGLLIDQASIPILPECRDICDALGLEPTGLIASGSLLATTSQSDSSTVIAALESKGISATTIGTITDPSDGLVLVTADGPIELPTFERDELARYFGH